MSPNPHRVFISSSMGELAPERKVVHATLKGLELEPFAFEKDAPASPLPAKEVWEIELKAADVCLVMLYHKLGAYTLDEINLARELEMPILLYVKVGDPHPDDDLAERRPLTNEVQDYLDSVDHVETGLTPKWFEEAEELPHEVTKSFEHLKRHASHRLRQRAIDDAAPVHGKSRVGQETAHGTELAEEARVPVTMRPVELRNKVDRFSTSFFGRKKERRNLLKLVGRQAFTPIVGLDDMGRKAIVQKMAYEEFQEEFPDGAGITPMVSTDLGAPDEPAPQTVAPSVAADEPVDDILQAIWEAVYDAEGITVEADRRRLDLKKLNALVALTDVELDDGRVQELVNALENSKIIATMPDGHAPIGRPVKVAPMAEPGDLIEMLVEEIDVEIDTAMGELVAAKFAPTGGLPQKVGELIAEAFDEVDDEAALATWLGAPGS